MVSLSVCRRRRGSARISEWLSYCPAISTNAVHRYVPEVSALAANPDAVLEVDSETKDLLKSLGMDSLPVSVTTVTSFVQRERKARFVPGAGRS